MSAAFLRPPFFTCAAAADNNSPATINIERTLWRKQPGFILRHLLSSASNELAFLLVRLKEFSQLFGTTTLVIVSYSIPTVEYLTTSIEQDVLRNETDLYLWSNLVSGIE